MAKQDKTDILIEKIDRMIDKYDTYHEVSPSNIFRMMSETNRMLNKYAKSLAPIKPKDVKKKDGLTIMLNLSDEHFGKKSIIETTEKKKEIYNIDIAVASMNKAFDKFIEIINEKTLNKIDEIIINILGDNIEGDGSIYSYQKMELDMEIIWQMTKYKETLMKNIIKLSAFTKNKIPIKLKCTPGNHGQKRGSAAMHPIRDNYDTMIYVDLSNQLDIFKSTGKMINISIDYTLNNNEFIYETKGKKIMLKHDMRKNPFTPTSKLDIMTRSIKAEGIDYILTGHYHESFVHSIGKTKLIRVGCMCGSDWLSNNIGVYEEGRMQSVMVVGSKDNDFEYHMIDVS